MTKKKPRGASSTDKVLSDLTHALVECMADLGRTRGELSEAQSELSKQRKQLEAVMTSSADLAERLQVLEDAPLGLDETASLDR